MAPEFFIPHAADATMAEEVYASIRAFMESQGYGLTDRRIYEIHYTHNSQPYVSTVGKDERREGVCIAILETTHPGPLYLVCTPNRGVVRGDPVLVGGPVTVQEFAAPGQARHH